MVEHSQSGRLCAFPFPGLQDLVDEILLHRAEEVIDIRPYPNYHKVLFAWRIRHGDFQGGTFTSFLAKSDDSRIGHVSTSSIIEECFNDRDGR